MLSPVVTAAPAKLPTSVLPLPPLAIFIPALSPNLKLSTPDVGVDKEPSEAILKASVTLEPIEKTKSAELL